MTEEKLNIKDTLRDIGNINNDVIVGDIIADRVSSQQVDVDGNKVMLQDANAEAKALLDKLNNMSDTDIKELAKNTKNLNDITPDAISALNGVIPDDIAKQISMYKPKPKVKPRIKKSAKDKRKAKLAKQSKKRNRR